MRAKSSIQRCPALCIQSLASDTAIGLHALQNPACAQHFDDSKFSILAQGCALFHLSALEVTLSKLLTLLSSDEINSCTA